MWSTKHGKLFEVRRVMTVFFTLVSTGMEVMAWDAVTTSVRNTSPHALAEARCLLMVKGEAFLLSPEEFDSSACAVCYTYNPRDPSQPIKRTRWNIRNITLGYWLQSPNGTEVVEARADEALGPEEMLTRRERDKWRECCAAAKRTCREKLMTQHIVQAHLDQSSMTGTCPSVWDGWSFWSETPAGQLVYGPCPSYIMYSSNSCPEAYRECRSNGTWSPRSDYKSCLTYGVRRLSIEVFVVEYAVSIAFLVPALAIFFLLYRQLLGHRITLHRNLFVSLLLHAGTQVLYQKLVVLSNMKSVSETGSLQDGVMCIYLNVATKYFRCSSFMWMFCEGYYLHRVLAAAFSPDGSTTVFYLIGWGLPIIPTSIYTILRTIEDHNSCWTGYSDFEWVLFVPNIIGLVANLIFLVSILRVLTQLRQPIEHEPSHYRRAVRATLVLVPLLGLHFVLTLYRPKQCDLQRVLEHVDHALDGLQGALVACLFCFFNGEVHELLRRARRTLVDRYQPGLRPSRGSHSFSTAQATLVTPASSQAPRVI